MSARTPIGVFDSGFGGLTIFRKIRELLPQYDYVYLGDNARTPYGNRSFEAVLRFTTAGVDTLFALDCPLCVIACNTASAKALRSIQQRHLPFTPHPDRRVLGVIRPTVEAIAIAKPTKSRAKYAQMIGRGTRPLPGVVDADFISADHRKAAIAQSAKPSFMVIDFAGNSGRHKLVNSCDVLGGKLSEDQLDAIKQRVMAKANSGPVQVDDEIEAKLKEIEEEKKLQMARRAKLIVRVNWSSKNVSPFDVFDVSPAPPRSWYRYNTLTEKQKNVLRRQGIEPDDMPFHEAKQLLETIFKRFNKGLCSFREAKCLLRMGVDANSIPRTHARQIIEHAKSNGWRKDATIQRIVAEGQQEMSMQDMR